MHESGICISHACRYLLLQIRILQKSGHSIVHLKDSEKGQQSTSGNHMRWFYSQNIETQIPM